MISGGLRASCRRAPAGASPRPEAGANDSAFTQKTYVHAAGSTRMPTSAEILANPDACGRQRNLRRRPSMDKS